MSSSMLTADKRWAAHTRKSGMTVLGKIPKPINLPSQRLENNGLDPNVEIVPKGTLTWGSKPASAATNAWGSSSLLSPRNDGGSSSPSHINGRPSSGGGTRPSTAGSDKSLDSSNAWGPNSRPSTASGILPSHHLPMAATRPRSAETRPGSSQLSRFAESSVDNTKATIRTLDKSGLTSHEFTLSSGDFPTLGSEKNSESHNQRGHSSHGCPTSSSGREVAPNELGRTATTGAGEVTASSNYQNVKNIVRTEHPYDGVIPVPPPNLQTDPHQAQPYPNLSMAPQQFDSMRAPPPHPPEGMWHRGAAPCGPYRPAGPPGSFPVDPFAYYPQFPFNSEAAARQGAGQGGYHPKNGDACHPHMPPNSYVINQPVIPVRPIFHSSMPYDGYYGPPRANFSNAGERDAPFMGVPHHPGILNQYPTQNDKVNPGQSQRRAGRHETAMPKEQVESDQVHVARRGQHKILFEHQDHSEGSREPERKVQPGESILPHPDWNVTDMNMKGDTRDAFGEKEVVFLRLTPDQKNFPGTSSKSHSSDSEKALAHPRETDGGILQNKLKDDHSVALDQQPVIKKNVALIEKIEGLNNKARSADAHARNVVESFSSRDAKTKQSKGIDTKADNVIKDISSSAFISNTASTTGKGISVSDKSVVQNPSRVLADDIVIVASSESPVTEVSRSGKLGESIPSHAHRRGNTSRNKRDAPAKERTNNFAGDGWKGHSLSDSSPMANVANAQHDQPSYDSNHQESCEAIIDEPHQSSLDSLDYKDQRAKLIEMAAQRVKQRQEEEEERTRQQKAKALAKLEELNRRSLSQNQKKSDDVPPQIDDLHHNQESGVSTSSKFGALTAESSGVASAVNPATSPASNVSNELKNIAASAESHSCTVSHPPEAVTKDNVIHNSSSSAKSPEIYPTEHIPQKTSLLPNDGNVSKHKQGGYRRRQVISQEKNPSEKPISTGSTENIKNVSEANVDTLKTDAIPHEDPLTQSKKGGRHSRSKRKVDDAPASSTLLSVMQNEERIVKGPSEPKTQPHGVVISSSIVPAEVTNVTVGSITLGDVSIASSNQGWLKATEEAYGMVNNRSRPQQPRRSGKNQHGARPVEKLHANESVIWAPVKQPSKTEHSEEGGLNSTTVASAQPSGKNNNDSENVTRTKRAEMERYVPKPLSKELQGQTLSADNQVASADMSGKSNLDGKSLEKETLERSTVAKTGVAADPKRWEDKKNSRHGRMHASWRRRNADASVAVLPSSVEYSDNSHDTQFVQKPSDHRQPPEPDNLTEKQFKSDGYDAAENSSAPIQSISLPVSTKDHGVTNSRQRHQQTKPQRIEGGNHTSNNNKEREGGTDGGYQIQSPASDNQSDHRNSLRSDIKNTGAAVHPRAHWKPKSSTHSQNNAQVSGGNEGKVDVQGGRSEMEHSQGFDSTLHSKGSSNNAQKNSGNGEKDARFEQGKGDMKYEEDILRSQGTVLKQDALTNARDDAEQQLNPALRRHGQHNGRDNRGPMYRGRGHDAGKPNLGTNGDKRKSGTHFEYQPVGSYSKPADLQQNPSVDEPMMEGHPVSGPVYRERSHNRPRPAGHFVRRTGGSAAIANSYRDE